eukprot:2088829-Pyramimonas_sp.AAC.2
MANACLSAFHGTSFAGPSSELVSYKVDSTGRKRVYGNKNNLKTSQGYTRMFGEGSSTSSPTRPPLFLVWS